MTARKRYYGHRRGDVMLHCLNVARWVINPVVIVVGGV